MQITVLGKGTFGKAIGSLLDANRVAFAYVDIDLPMEQVADLVFITVPTQHIRAALRTNARFFTPSTVFVNCAKGIEEQTHLLPHQIVAHDRGDAAYYALVGPSFASEILTGHPTLVSLGFGDRLHVQTIKDLVQTDSFRVAEAPGFESLELAAALKNVYAIACGFAAGLGYAMNTRAKLITLALNEFASLARAMCFAYDTLAAPAIVGDLVLTCSSTESRNFTFGVHLATSDATTALAKVGATVEGFYTSHSIQALAQTYQVELPLASLTHRLIEGGADAIPSFRAFVATR
jgi:glycerol-3-phosphate dehydrogenase (NAD(P)+)